MKEAAGNVFYAVLGAPVVAGRGIAKTGGKVVSIARNEYEAFAIEASGQGVGMRAQTMALASLRRQLLPLRHLGTWYPESMPQSSIARAQAVDFVRYLASHHDEGLGPLMANLRRGRTFDQALEETYASDAATLEHAWRRDVARRFSFLPIILAGALVWLLIATGAG